jgi:exoribonuclease II
MAHQADTICEKILARIVNNFRKKEKRLLHIISSPQINQDPGCHNRPGSWFIDNLSISFLLKDNVGKFLDHPVRVCTMK